MPVLSKIGSFFQFKPLLKKLVLTNFTRTAARGMSDHGPKLMNLTPSRFQWHKFKDVFHFYVMVGAIPFTALIFYTNVFIGQATLTEIPEEYYPKHWEYHRHPITRFMARYFYASPQQEYEKMCHSLNEEQEKMAIRKLEKKIRETMAERNDFQSYYYRPAIAKYHRVAKQASDELAALEGDN